MDKYEFDILVSKRYTAKLQNAQQRGIEFKLTLTSVRNIMRAKRCYYTGVHLTLPRPGKALRGTDVTIERVDSRKGYVTGNVVAVCHAANNVKSFFEGGGCLSMGHALKMFAKVNKRLKG